MIFPLKTMDFPIKNDDFPIKNDVFPSKNDGFPMKNDDFPIEKRWISHSSPQQNHHSDLRASPPREVNAMSEPMGIRAAGVEHDIRPVQHWKKVKPNMSWLRWLTMVNSG